MEILIVIGIVLLIFCLLYVNRQNKRRLLDKIEQETLEKYAIEQELAQKEADIYREKEYYEELRKEKLRLERERKARQEEQLKKLASMQNNLKQKDDNELLLKRIADLQRFNALNKPVAPPINQFKNYNFDDIREVSVSIIRDMQKNYTDKLYEELQQGVAILDTDEHLHMYMYSYGKMHQAKLNSAFDTIFNGSNFIANNQDIEIIDYGCGQGIGSIIFIDYLKKQRDNFKLVKIKLIEPSSLALRRSDSNVRKCLQTLSTKPSIESFCKNLDDIKTTELLTNNQSIKFHIFSNILDVHGVSVQKIVDNIAKTQKGTNYFICVSPNIHYSRNNKLDDFMKSFSKNGNYQTKIISERASDIGKWKRYEKVFRVQI